MAFHQFGTRSNERRPQPPAEASPFSASYGRSEIAVTDKHGAQTVFGEDRPVAASADIERFAKVVMVTVSMMAVSMMTMAVATMPMTAAGGRGSDRSRGQSESRDGSEGNLAKHSCSPFQA